jgi:hypothetical protein
MQELWKYKADLYRTDEYGVSPYDLIANPGAFPPEQAERIFGVKQRPSRKIDRILHPEDHPSEKAGWYPGNGQWSTERLKGYETAMECEGVDQYWAHEIDGDTVFKKYLARNIPVMIRGAMGNWSGVSLL